MAITNLSLENLQKLQGFKQAWETGDSAAKAAASKGATDLRKSLGIASDTLSLGDVNELIRLKQTEQAKAQPIAAQPTAPAQTVDTQSLINQLAEAQKQKNIASLGQAYQTSLGTLAEEEKQIAPQYEAQRTQAKIQNQMQMKAFENWLANQGLSASGAAPQGAISQTVALQNTLGSSQLAQQKALEDVARRRTQLGTDYQFGLANAEADVNISAMQNALNQANQDAQLALQKRSMDLQEQGMNADEAYRQATFEYQKIQDTKAFDYTAQQDAINQAMNEAALTGMYQGQQTLQGKAAQSDLATQALQQQILQGQVNTLPYETQLLAQQVQAGLIDIETAKARLAEIKSGSGSGSSGTISGGIEKTGLPNVNDYIDVINKQKMNINDIQTYLENLSLAGVDDNTILTLGRLYGLTPMTTEQVMNQAGANIQTVPKITPTLDMNTIRSNLMKNFFMQ